MSSQIIIELREQDTTATNYDTGDYEIILEEPIDLDEGDVITCKNIFIDTEGTSQGLINVEPDEPNGSTTTIGIDFIPYIYDWGTTKIEGSNDVTDHNYEANPFGSGTEKATGEHFILCDRNPNPAGGGLNVKEVTGFELDNIAPTNHEPPENINDPIQFHIQYIDPSNNMKYLDFYVRVADFKAHTAYSEENQYSPRHPQYRPVLVDKTIPLCDNHGHPTPNSEVFPFLARDNSVFTDPQRRWKNNGGIDPNTLLNGQDILLNSILLFNPQGGQGGVQYNNVVGVGDVLTPRIIPYQFTIPARAYAPDELAKKLTQEFTRDSTIGFNDDPLDIVNNPLLTTSEKLKQIGYSVSHSSPTTINNPPYFLNNDCNCILQIAPIAYGSPSVTNNYLVGTDQFAVTFNQTSGAEGFFSLDQTHFPLYHEQSEVVKGIDSGLDSDGVQHRFIANKHSGIIIARLLPFNLWYNQLKFSQTEIETIAQVKQNVTIESFADITAFTMKIQDGENVTGSVKGIDTIVSKVDVKDGAVIPFDRSPNFPFNTIITQNIIISAKDNIKYGTDENRPYYLIEITSGFSTDKRSGRDKNTKIMGIVNKYYQQSSGFTTDDSQGSFTYEHIGQSQKLSSFRVRILNPDSSLSDGLKNNSSVFLQIIKNNKNEK